MRARTKKIGTCGNMGQKGQKNTLYLWQRGKRAYSKGLPKKVMIHVESQLRLIIRQLRAKCKYSVKKIPNPKSQNRNFDPHENRIPKSEKFIGFT